MSSVAQQSLYSKVENDNSQVKKMILPDFREVCQFVHEKSMERMKNVNQRVTIQNRELPFNDVTFTEVCFSTPADIDHLLLNGSYVHYKFRYSSIYDCA